MPGIETTYQKKYWTWDGTNLTDATNIITIHEPTGRVVVGGSYHGSYTTGALNIIGGDGIKLLRDDGITGVGRIFRNVSDQLEIEGADNQDLVITSLGSQNTEGIAFNNDLGSELMRIQRDGKVGIGTATPTEPLHIETVSGEAWQRINTATASQKSGIKFAETGAVRGGIYGSGSTNYLHLFGGGTATEHMTINNVGNVGIGTTSPAEILDVAGDTNTTVILGRAKIGSPVTDIMYLAHYDRLSSTAYAISQTSTGATSVNSGGGNDLILRTNNTARMRVGSSGNIGIGVSTIDEKLHVLGNIKGDVLRLTDQQAFASPSAGDIRWNTNTLKHEGYDGTSWNAMY